LRCTGCRRIHHELPEIFVPYKRYEAESIESVLSEGQSSDVATDDSTLYRWQKWFVQIGAYWSGCLQSIASRFVLSVEATPIPSPSVLQQIRRYVGLHRGWLARLVRPIVHAHLWVHTRFACLSATS
jgi:hypothetical protein